MPSILRFLGVVLIFASLVRPAPAQPQAVNRKSCFPVEALPLELQPKAEALLVRLLDSEALYTVAGQIKPLSDGFWQSSFPESDDSSPTVEETRRIVSAFACGDDLTAGVYVFARAFDGKRSATAFVANRPLVRGVVLNRPDIFAPLGVTLLTEPGEILAKIDRADEATRWRAFGLLFGYPDEAVEFFVAAGLAQKSNGKFVERDFRHIPTFNSKEGRFVYAVPKGRLETCADTLLKARAGPVLAEYARRRANYIADGQLGAAKLLRDWFDNGRGCCSPRFARFDTPVHLQELNCGTLPFAHSSTRGWGDRCGHCH